MNRCVPLFLLLLMPLPLGACMSTMGSVSPVSLTPADPGVGALGDGLVGQIQGLKLNPEERARALNAEFQALQFTAAGTPVTWSAEGVEGSVVPTQLYRIGTQDCRAFSHTVSVSGRAVAGQGTACRTGKSDWKVV